MYSAAFNVTINNQESSDCQTVGVIVTIKLKIYDSLKLIYVIFLRFIHALSFIEPIKDANRTLE